MSIPQRRMYFYLLDEQERIFKSVGRRAIQKIDESISLTDTNIVSKSAGIEYISEDVQAELDRAMYVAIPRFRESDLYETYTGPTRYDFYYIAEGSHDGDLVVLTLHESGMEELNASITGSRMSAQDSEGRDIEVSARSVIPGILSGTNFNFSWNSTSTDTSIFTYDTEPVSTVLEDFVRVYGLEMEYVVEFDGSEVSERIIKFYDEIGRGADRPVDRISYAHDSLSVKKTEARDSIRTALIGIGSKKDVQDLPHQIVADNEVATRSQLGLSGTHMGRSNWLSHSEAESLAKNSKALAKRLGAKRVQEQVVQAGMTLYESNINFKDYEFKKSEGFPVDKPKGQEYIEIPELTQINGIKTSMGMKPKVGVSKHTDVISIKELAWLAYYEILEVNRKRITYTASATILNANIGDFVTVAYPNINLNDTKRVVSISRNRLDDTIEGVTLGDHRAKSALRRAQEVQKKEEEEFVDTFMNQRPGGSNRTRSFNPLGTNFSPRDFGRFGRGNYGTIENPIGRDLFDSEMYENLGLEPGQTVPDAIGEGGGGVSGATSFTFADYSDAERYNVSTSPYATNHLGRYEYPPIKSSGSSLGLYNEEGEFVEYGKYRTWGNIPNWQIVQYVDGTMQQKTLSGSPDDDKLDNFSTIYGLQSNPSNYSHDYAGKTIDLEFGIRKDHAAKTSGNYSIPFNGASVGMYTEDRSNPYQQGYDMGIFLNQLTGNIEVLEPKNTKFMYRTRHEDENSILPRDQAVPLSMYVDQRAIAIVQFYMEKFIFPIMAAELKGVYSDLDSDRTRMANLMRLYFRHSRIGDIEPNDLLSDMVKRMEREAQRRDMSGSGASGDENKIPYAERNGGLESVPVALNNVPKRAY